jgi:hypothetical protein
LRRLIAFALFNTRPNLGNDARSGIGATNRINVIARPARQKINSMAQLNPIDSSEIGTELGDNLAFKLGTLGRFSHASIKARIITAARVPRYVLRFT